MKIHNFLTDLLISTKLLLCDNIFKDSGSNFFKHFEFNLGNRSFQFTKEPTVNYSLPAVIVSINDDMINFGGRRTDLVMRNQMGNVNKIPVLYNSTQDVAVYVHEEQTTVGFAININCESQLMAKEIAYTVKRFLPLNKILNVFTFISYLEIETNLLLDILKFNIPFDNIQNLYTKLNYNTGKPEYCFSLSHNPLIRFDSINTTTTDSTQPTYQVQIELTYIIQFPQYLILEHFNIVDTINFSFNVDKSSIVTMPFTRIYSGEEPDYKIDRTLIISTDDTSTTDSVNISKTDTQVMLSIKFDINDFIILSTYKYRFYKNSFGLMIPVDQTPTYYYPSENQVVFVFDIDTYNTKLIPSNTTPMFVDFYYDIEVNS